MAVARRQQAEPREHADEGRVLPHGACFPEPQMPRRRFAVFDVYHRALLHGWLRPCCVILTAGTQIANWMLP